MAAGGTLVKQQTFDVDKSTPVWLVNARKDIGVTEWTKTRHNPNPIVQHWVQQAMGNDELVDVTSDDHPWCAMYVGAKLVQAGYPSSHSGMARSYMRYGTAIDKHDDSQWKQGDIAVFWRGSSNDGVTGHVAFLLSWDARYVYILGGNQSDEVCIIKEPRAKILAVSRPRSFFSSKTALSSGGSAATGVAKAVVGVAVADGAANATSPHVASTPIDGLTIDPATLPKMPSPEDLQTAYDQAHPYLSMLAHVKPELMWTLTALSAGLALYAGWWRYKDWTKGRT